MLAAGLHGLFILGEDYVSMVHARMKQTWPFSMLFTRLDLQAVNQAN